MNRLETGQIRKDHSFVAIQALLLCHGLRLLADLRVFIPKEHVLMEFEHLGSDKEPSRLPTVEEDDTGTTILVKKGEGIRLKIRDEEGEKDYLIHDYRRRKNSVTGILNEAFGLIRHRGNLRKEGNRYRMNAGKTKTIRENSSATLDGNEFTHFIS